METEEVEIEEIDIESFKVEPELRGLDGSGRQKWDYWWIT